jgi:lysozyme family protein
MFPACVEFVLANETFTRNGQTVSIYEDDVTGEISNWGISLAWFRGLKPMATHADIEALTREGAISLYRTYFWTPRGLSAIQLPKTAAKVFDAEVNMGATQGVRLLQRALLLQCDGVLGPVTAAVVNAENDEDLYRKFVRQAADRYQRIHDNQVTEYGQVVADKNLSAWLARLAKAPKV